MMTPRCKRPRHDFFQNRSSVLAPPGFGVALKIRPVVGPNLHDKLTILKAASSVVSLRSFIGKREVFLCSGIIVESEPTEGNAKERYVHYVVTAATLLAGWSYAASFPSNIKVKVYLSDGRSCKGVVDKSTVDFHYNIAVIKIMSNAPLPVAVLRHLDVSVPILSKFPGDSKPTLVHSDFKGDKLDDDGSCNLHPGDQVIALGRLYHHSVLLAKGGEFSVEECRSNCPEHLMTSCKTNERFIGGPLVNRNGEVLGINFSDHGYTMFLPTDLVWRCFKNLRKHELVRRPCHGIELADLYRGDVALLEKVFQKFPDICGGIIVKKVEENSAADRAGLLPMDIIHQCNGNTINCSVEFFAMMWDNAGESVELEVKRVNGRSLRLTLIVEEATRDDYDRWQL